MLSVGVDIVEIERVERAVVRWNGRFLKHVYTDAEVALCRGRVPELAVRFAGKEAISKALGTGLVGVSWREMEVLSDERGKPLVFLHGRAAERAAKLGLGELAISLSHSQQYAVALVVGGDMARIDTTFASKLQSQPQEQVRLIVRVAGDMGQANTRLTEMGVITLRSFGLTKAVSVECSAETALTLLKEPWVLSVEEDRQVFTQK
jgi:holo-[acyl-carrier protein] synthase